MIRNYWYGVIIAIQSSGATLRSVDNHEQVFV